MRPVFCFIDDTPFELNNFAQHAAPAFAPLEVVLAESFSQAQERLQGCLPLCFLLDLYGQDPACLSPAVTPLEGLLGLLGPDPDLAGLYEGLDQAGASAGNLYLRRLYAQVERWQRVFLGASGALGQNRAFGLANLEQVRAHYPWAAALAYSRKALYADAMALSVAGAEGILQKPQGADDAAIAQATQSQAPGLAQAARDAVGRRLARLAGGLLASLLRQGEYGALSQALAQALAGLEAPAGPQRAAARAALGAAPAPPRPPDQALVRALETWLDL